MSILRFFSSLLIFSVLFGGFSLPQTNAQIWYPNSNYFYSPGYFPVNFYQNQPQIVTPPQFSPPEYYKFQPASSLYPQNNFCSCVNPITPTVDFVAPIQIQPQTQPQNMITNTFSTSNRTIPWNESVNYTNWAHIDPDTLPEEYDDSERSNNGVNLREIIETYPNATFIPSSTLDDND